MKKSIFLFFAAILCAVGMQAKTTATVYYSIPASTVGCYTVKCYYNFGYSQTGLVEMTKENKTSNGNLIYSVKLTADHDNVDELLFQLFDGNTWKSQKTAMSGWTALANNSGKMYNHSTSKWVSYTTDPSCTVYYVDQNNWESNIRAYAWNSDCDKNQNWSGASMTSTGEKYNGKNIYSITFEKRYNNIIFSKKGENKTNDLTLGTTNAGKMFTHASNTGDWIAYTYDVKVTFDANGHGTAPVAQTVLKGNKITEPVALSEEGYTFGGWYKETECTTPWNFNTDVLNDDVTLYAKWTEITHTVTFASDGNGTTNQTGEVEVGVVTGIEIDATPNTDYEFNAWESSNGGSFATTAANASNTFYPTANTTLTATFRSTAVNALLVVAGANIASVTGSKEPVTLGETCNITATPKDGYSFEKWVADPEANGVFADATSANTTVTVQNASVTVTASAVENMSTLTTSNKYDAGDPSYTIPSATESKIGITTTAEITATATGNGYTFTGWTLENCVRTDAGTADATTITVRSNGDGKAATVVANYAEDLATTKWYISGNGNGSGNDLTPGSPFTGWGTSGTQMFKKSGESTKEIYYCTITANTVASSDDHFPFKVYNETNNKYWGNNDYWVTKENNHPTLSDNSGNNMKFRPYLIGTYEFKLDATNASAPVLTVTWPVYNQLRISAANPADEPNIGNFDMTGSDTYTVTRSLKANTTYTFKIVYNSDWYGANSGNLTRASSTKTLTTSGGDLTIKTDIAGDYTFTFTFDSSDKKLTVAYPQLPKHQVSASVNPTESGTIEGVAEYEQGTYATLTATAAEGYKFVNWTKGENVVSTEAKYKFIVNEPVELVANFERVHDVKISCTCNGVEIQSQTQKIGEATQSTITAPSIENYTFISWEVGDGITVVENKNEKISILTKSEGNYVLTANYERIARYLTGNDAVFGMEGESTWHPNKIQMEWDEASIKYSYTVSLQANKYYKFRITDGTWAGKWGYSNLQPAIDNVFAAEDNNISFVLSAAGDLTIAFDGTNIELTTTSSFAAPVYTIVGDAAITGCHWDVNSIENQMVQDATDKNKYTLVKTVRAVAGEYDYKGIRNYSYDWEVAPGNKLNIDKDGTGKITYTLDISTKQLTADVSNWEEEVVAHEVTLVGIGENKNFSEAADRKTTSVAVDLEANSVYTFEIIVNSVYMKNNGIMWRGNCTDWTFKSEENNAHIVTDLAGTYTFTWTYDGNKLSVTYPEGSNVPAPIFLGGEMNGWDWTKTLLIPSTDSKTASAIVNLTEAKKYEFKIRQGDDHLGNNGTMTRENNNQAWTFAKTDNNCTITADIIGDYVFTWNYEKSELIVTYPEIVTPPTIIGEGENNLNDGEIIDVQVNRQFATGNIYTLSLPFALDNVEEIFGNGTSVYQFSALTKNASEELVLYFDKVTSIAAATPYLIEPAQAVDGFTVENATISTTPNNISFTADATKVTMKPILSATAGSETNGEYWLAADRYLYNNVNTLLSLRALFNISTVSGMPPRCRVALGENAETAVEEITTTVIPTKVIENGQLIIIRDGIKYNAQGQKL